MDRQMIRQELAGVVLSLDEIIAGEGESAHGASELKRCREELKALLDDLSGKGMKVDPAKVAVVVYKAIDLVYSWSLDRKRR